MTRLQPVFHKINGKVPCSDKFADREQQIRALLAQGRLSVIDVAKATWQGSDTNLSKLVIDGQGIISDKDNERWTAWIEYVRTIEAQLRKEVMNDLEKQAEIEGRC